MDENGFSGQLSIAEPWRGVESRSRLLPSGLMPAPFEQGPAFAVIALLHQQLALAELQVGEIRLEGKGVSSPWHRTCEPGIDAGTVVQRLGIIRFERDGLSSSKRGLGQHRANSRVFQHPALSGSSATSLSLSASASSNLFAASRQTDRLLSAP